MSELPRGLEQAFLVAASELGFCSASWLFVREFAGAGGAPLVHQLRDELGRSFPVLDAVAAQWLANPTATAPDCAAVVAACRAAKRILVVGFEADCLDALLPQLPTQKFCLLRYSAVGDVDWDRILANYEDRVEATDLASFQQFAGTSSVVLTFLYGASEHAAHVSPAWLRLIGEDVRAQFRSFIGWNILPRPMYVYPRWLVEVPRSDFTVLA